MLELNYLPPYESRDGREGYKGIEVQTEGQRTSDRYFRRQGRLMAETMGYAVSEFFKKRKATPSSNEKMRLHGF